ncbi:hypothetical protein EGI31_12700 [Lacihabitans soyangensis]|uniref:Uncharacterized protein n=1 Tax=Lacihabitans soyangensis TaxID=869394 RepID=A0AAE3H4C7_9BACT|nr:hypothetical protein [Lacihabitans soyangensis]
MTTKTKTPTQKTKGQNFDYQNISGQKNLKIGQNFFKKSLQNNIVQTACLPSQHSPTPLPTGEGSGVGLATKKRPRASPPAFP